MERRVSIYTFGCKVNRYETRWMQENFALNGFAPGTDQDADLAVINSCCVTAHAEKDTRNLAGRLVRRGIPVVVTGCLAALPAGKVRLPAGVVRLRRKDLADRYFVRRTDRVHGFPGRTRAFVKVEDGCNAHCTYCIIPRVRGPVSSRSESDILSEITYLVRTHHEIVLTGINLGSYGLDRGESLSTLLARVCAVPGVHRLRLSSIEVQYVVSEFLEVCASQPAVCRHLHIPLQSGSDRILSAMGRSYRADDYEEMVEQVRAALPGVTVTTDVMVGFPGESDCDCEKTAALIERARFLRVHVFPFSARPGTPAEAMEGRLPPDEVKRRVDYLMAAGSRSAEKVMQGFGGREAEVLVEARPEDGFWRGYSREYLPVRIPREAAVPGTVVRVVLGHPDQGCLPALRVLCGDGNSQERSRRA